MREDGCRYRHELKYLIHDRDRLLLKARFGGLIAPDAHAGPTGSYKIRSLYFDDYFGSAYEEKLMGVAGRAKYRIRFYNDDPSFIRLERKLKRDSYIAKQSAPLSRDDVSRILRGDVAFLLERPAPLLAEFYYEYTAKALRPRVVVDYDREPYYLETGEVRLTFDRLVRAGSALDDPFDPLLPTVDAMDRDVLVLEVKYTELLPSMIRRALPRDRADGMALSKFVVCCDALDDPAGLGKNRG